jgi:hypothetical protein
MIGDGRMKIWRMKINPATRLLVNFWTS